MMDVYGACEVLADRIRSTPILVTKRASWQDGFERETNSTLSSDYFRFDLKTVDKFTRRRNLTLVYELDNRGLTELSSLGMLNPMTVAWELVPFSFVWDWWNPVGDYLNLMDADRGFIYRGGCWGDLQKATRTVTPSNGRYAFRPSRPDWAQKMIKREIATATVGSAENAQYNRSPIFFPPSSQIYAKSPFGSIKRAISAVALLRTIF